MLLPTVARCWQKKYVETYGDISVRLHVEKIQELIIANWSPVIASTQALIRAQVIWVEARRSRAVTLGVAIDSSVVVVDCVRDKMHGTVHIGE